MVVKVLKIKPAYQEAHIWKKIYKHKHRGQVYILDNFVSLMSKNVTTQVHSSGFKPALARHD